jgi:hypothetical protein
VSKSKKKPPPDNPGNLAGRKALRRKAAWDRACGGILITIGKEGEKYQGTGARRKVPEDVQERFKKELAKGEAEWKKQRRAAPVAPEPKKEPPADTEGVDMIDFLLD